MPRAWLAQHAAADTTPPGAKRRHGPCDGGGDDDNDNNLAAHGSGFQRMNLDAPWGSRRGIHLRHGELIT
jgi:hypothetical protein